MLILAVNVFSIDSSSPLMTPSVTLCSILKPRDSRNSSLAAGEEGLDCVCLFIGQGVCEVVFPCDSRRSKNVH